MKKQHKPYTMLSLSMLFATVYMVSYLTRINFGAIVSEMERATGIGKDLLSLSLTGSFITYGAGQIISGIAVDRISPKKLISLGLTVTAVTNLLMPLCGSPYLMLAVWCVNGFAQSFMWPPIVKMLSQLVNEEEYKQASVIVSWGCSVGTILVYLLAPAVIALLNWRWVFLLSSICAIVMLIVWQGFRYTPAPETVQAQDKKGNLYVLFTPLMLGVMGAIILQGMLRDGVTTWMPSYISETYQMSTASSILSGVILPVFSILCFQFASTLYQRRLKNPLTCAALFFGAGLLAAGGLYLVTGKNAVMSILLSAILTGCMHGVNLMFISMLPPYFKRYGLTGTASGVLNSCTYIGSALSTYGVAVISAGAGWKTTVLIWMLIAACGTALSAAGIRAFREKFL